MSKNTSVLIGDHYRDFIRAQVSTGRYTSVSEVVRAALRLMEEDEERKANLLRSAIQAGEQSGLAVPYDHGEFKKRLREKYLYES